MWNTKLTLILPIPRNLMLKCSDNKRFQWRAAGGAKLKLPTVSSIRGFSGLSVPTDHGTPGLNKYFVIPTINHSITAGSTCLGVLSVWIWCCWSVDSFTILEIWIIRLLMTENPSNCCQGRNLIFSHLHIITMFSAEWVLRISNPFHRPKS